MKDYYGWRARIGLIYPAEGLVMEPEFHAMAPDGVSIHPTRIDLSKTTLTGLSEMMDDDRLDVAAQLYGRAPLHVLTFGGTSASLCARHVWQLGGESPLSNLMEVKD